MTSSQRIALNTIATYGCTVFGMALGLFSSRWVLLALGEVDYGLMGVVGSAIIFIIFLNGVTSAACARFFAFSIGKGDISETNRWFNTALSIHTILPVVLIIVGYPIGIWAVKHFFNIPPERLDTAIWVFRLSLISAFMHMCFAPYIGMFIAKQRIYERSLWGILKICLMFALAYSLFWCNSDVWLFYCVGTVGIAIAIDFGQVLRAHFIFPECRIDISAWWHRSYIQKLFSFAGWQLFGSFGSLLRGSGTAILLNKYFPPSIFPAVNASYSIGNTVSGHTQTLSGALLGAFTPEITSTEGRGDRQRMLSLANKASKFGVWLILLFAVPLLLEVQGVLTLWLKRPPELAATFCVLIIMQFLIEQLTFGHRVAVNAVGKIAGYQMMLGGLLILTLPIAWLFLAYGFPAQAVAWAFILTSSGLSIGRVIWARWLVGLSPWVWMRDVLVPCLSIFALTGLAGYCVRWLWGGFSFYRLCTVTFVTVVVWGIAGWLLILGPSEKHTLFSTIKKIKQKVV